VVEKTCSSTTCQAPPGALRGRGEHMRRGARRPPTPSAEAPLAKPGRQAIQGRFFSASSVVSRSKKYHADAGRGSRRRRTWPGECPSARGGCRVARP